MGQSRNENILENILGANNELVEPQSRIEALLMQMLNRGDFTMPLEDGAYVLKVTVTNGVPSYEWVSYDLVQVE